jgi:hypothetical protein
MRAGSTGFDSQASSQPQESQAPQDFQFTFSPK